MCYRECVCVVPEPEDGEVVEIRTVVGVLEGDGRFRDWKGNRKEGEVWVDRREFPSVSSLQRSLPASCPNLCLVSLPSVSRHDPYTWRLLSGTILSGVTLGRAYGLTGRD